MSVAACSSRIALVQAKSRSVLTRGMRNLTALLDDALNREESEVVVSCVVFGQCVESGR